MAMLLCLLYGGCGTVKTLDSDHLYFNRGADTVAVNQRDALIQPNDLLSIQVFSRTLNQEQAAIFNIPATASNPAPAYQVNTMGNIELPLVGAVKAAGLTRDMLQDLLVRQLSNHVKSPSVLVHFVQFHVNVLGEVRVPGVQKFSVDKVTIVDAIGAAGDLTDYGRRDEVLVMREVGGQQITYLVDLRSKDLFASPVYVLQPDDIVYVKPNKYKLKTLRADPDVQRRTGLIFSIVSLALGVATLIITSTR